MDRYWLLTSTTYGTWLPGDRRGFVGPFRNASGNRVIHHLPGEPYDRDMPALELAARRRLRGPPVHLTRPQAETLLAQFQQTAEYRHWLLVAAAIMNWHFHLVVGVEGDPEPERVLGDFKAYGSRVLNRCWGTPSSDTWWTTSGSKRKLANQFAVAAAVRYVQGQESPLVVWANPRFEEVKRGRSPGG